MRGGFCKRLSGLNALMSAPKSSESVRIWIAWLEAVLLSCVPCFTVSQPQHDVEWFRVIA
jgi:hypothetical protein